MNYFDTSALIKRFVEEPGSQVVDALIANDGGVATSRIAYAELHAALAMKLREGALSTKGYRNTSRSFDADWPAYLRVEVGDPVLLLARDLVRRHPLRGFDAIHLASALRLRDQLGEEILFIAADERLLAASAAERLKLADVRR